MSVPMRNNNRPADQGCSVRACVPVPSCAPMAPNRSLELNLEFKSKGWS